MLRPWISYLHRSLIRSPDNASQVADLEGVAYDMDALAFVCKRGRDVSDTAYCAVARDGLLCSVLELYNDSCILDLLHACFKVDRGLMERKPLPEV